MGAAAWAAMCSSAWGHGDGLLYLIPQRGLCSRLARARDWV